MADLLDLRDEALGCAGRVAPAEVVAGGDEDRVAEGPLDRRAASSLMAEPPRR